MAIKSNIIKQLKEHLIANTEAWSATPGYLDDVNDFPSVSIFIPRETRYHLSSSEAQPKGTVIKQFTFQIRGYVFADEDSTVHSDLLADEIEAAVNTFSYDQSDGNVFSTKVISLSTDEGLLSPYGVCDLEVLIDYTTC